MRRPVWPSCPSLLRLPPSTDVLTGDRDVVVMSLVIVLGRDFDWVSAHRGPAVERFGADYEADEVAFAKALAVISKVIGRAESSPLFVSL